VVLTILASAAFDAAGARNTPQLGVKAIFHRPIEPMLHFHFVRSEQIYPVGRKYAAR
jgi:hypothetical protein